MSATKPPTVGPHCGQVVSSNAGAQWHRLHGELSCATCLESNARYMTVHRARSGNRITVTVDDMIRFAFAWDRDKPDQRRAVRDALELMVASR